LLPPYAFDLGRRASTMMFSPFTVCGLAASAAWYAAGVANSMKAQFCS